MPERSAPASSVSPPLRSALLLSHLRSRLTIIITGSRCFASSTSHPSSSTTTSTNVSKARSCMMTTALCCRNLVQRKLWKALTRTLAISWARTCSPSYASDIVILAAWRICSASFSSYRPFVVAFSSCVLSFASLINFELQFVHIQYWHKSLSPRLPGTLLQIKWQGKEVLVP